MYIVAPLRFTLKTRCVNRLGGNPSEVHLQDCFQLSCDAAGSRQSSESLMIPGLLNSEFVPTNGVQQDFTVFSAFLLAKLKTCYQTLDVKFFQQHK